MSCAGVDSPVHVFWCVFMTFWDTCLWAELRVHKSNVHLYRMMPPTFCILTTVYALLCSILSTTLGAVNFLFLIIGFSSVQFSRSVVSGSLRPHESQHTRPPCPSPTPGVCPNPCPLSLWCHPTISSPVVPFSSHPQSFPASGSFQMSQFFTSGGQSIGVSALTALVRYNYFTFHEVHTLICTSQCFLVYSYSCILITTTKFQDISITSERNPTPTRGHILPQSHWQPLLSFCLFGFSHPGHGV